MKKYIFGILVLAFTLFILDHVLDGGMLRVPPPIESVTANNFNFDNYKYPSKELYAAVHKILPPGTSLDDVNKVLVDKAGAKCIECGRLKKSPVGSGYTIDYSHSGYARCSLLEKPTEMIITLSFDENLNLKPDNGDNFRVLSSIITMACFNL